MIIEKKTYNLTELTKIIYNLKKNKKTIGFSNGCFDLLHKGHISLIKKSKKLCDYLIIALNTDSSVKLLKGNNRPVDKQSIRIRNLSAMDEVDAIILFSSKTPIILISELLPNLLIKGEDYIGKEIAGSECVIGNGGQVHYIPLLKGFSTTNIINKVEN